MPRREQWYVARREFSYAGQKIEKGQLVKPAGGIYDSSMFGENTRWAGEFSGRQSDAEVCGTDGCTKLFDSLGSLERHRQRVHAPEREYMARVRRELALAKAEAEASGETIGGHEVVEVKRGPGGPVPYIQPGAVEQVLNS